MRSADVFILSSLWEEIGFVIVEAAFNNLFIISSDCPNGPKEFLENGKNGILFKNNSKNELFNNFNNFLNLKSLYRMQVNTLTIIRRKLLSGNVQQRCHQGHRVQD